ncbi:MAG: F0F1 ATP synthase subunit A [Deltaproteobacteria bacterium]|nr:F0F1 ATP synthase subunit A [Deltaproteobacteria bacterium]
MEELTDIQQITYQLFGYNLVFNVETITMTLIVMGLLLVFSLLATRKINIVPHYVQIVGELLVNLFYGLTKDTLNEEKAKTYFPLIFSVFLFVVFSNWLGIIPKLGEPTKDLNTPLGLAILGAAIAHYSGIRTKGIGGYLKEYFEPFFFMAPLNVIGELAKVVSISFRLYGNIMGGAIIILVVSNLVYSLVLPPVLVMFFGLFVGTIQAFVFTMLTLVYISLQVK